MLDKETLQNLLRRWHLRVLACCGVANPRHSTTMAAVCALQPIQNRSASLPQQVLQSFHKDHQAFFVNMGRTGRGTSPFQELFHAIRRF